MISSASPWIVCQSLTGLLFLTLAGYVMADTSPVSSQEVDITAQYSPADEQGRFTYMVDFVEPGVIDQHRSRSSGAFQRSAPANAAWRSQLQAAQAQRIDEMSQSLGVRYRLLTIFLTFATGLR